MRARRAQKPKSRGGVVLVGLVTATVVGLGLAAAQTGATNIDFTDPSTALQRASDSSSIGVNVRDDAAPRFSSPGEDTQTGEPRRMELELAAGGQQTGMPVDVSIAQRASLGANESGDLDRQGRGSEVRVGRGLVQERGADRGDGNSWYLFAASDNEALTWQPGSRNEFGGRGSSFSLEDRVEVGDMSAGVTYERNGVQASLAYVEREVSTTVGQTSVSQDENFTGLTVTMRR